MAHGGVGRPARAAEFEPPGTRMVGRFDQDFLFSLAPWEEGVVCAPDIPQEFRRP